MTEEPHFDKISFRIKKKIFATYDEINQRASLKLTKADQDIFCLADKGVIYPVDNKWGKQGWTIIEIKKISKELFDVVLTAAYCVMAPKGLSEKVSKNDR